MKKLFVFSVLVMSFSLAFGELYVVQTPLGVRLVWNPPATIGGGLAGYNLYRSDVSGGPYTKLGIIQPMVPFGTQEYTDSTVVCGKTYFWVAKSVGYCDTGFVESGYSNEATILVTWIPEAPVMGTPVVQGSNVYLRWDSPPALFAVMRANSASAPFSTIGQTTAFSWVDKLQPRQPAAYKVTAIGCGGQADSNVVLKPGR